MRWLIAYALIGCALMTIGALFDDATEDELRRAMVIGLFVGVPWALMILGLTLWVLVAQRLRRALPGGTP